MINFMAFSLRQSSDAISLVVDALESPMRLSLSCPTPYQKGFCIQ